MPYLLNATRRVGAAFTLVLPAGIVIFCLLRLSWDFFSFSTRLALELGLNRDPKVEPLDERHERELLNRRRTWMILSIIDGGASLETGQAPGVGKDEEVCRHSPKSKSKLNERPLAHIERIPLVLSVQVPAPLRRRSSSHYRTVEYHATVHRRHEVRWI